MAKWSDDTISVTQDAMIFHTRVRKTYVITGKLRNGKRFSPITTTTPQHYNIWSGNLWELVPDFKEYKLKRKLMRRLQ